jgi:type VI protein secretion system component VasK
VIREQSTTRQQATEPEAGRPEVSGEQWLGRNSSSKHRLWERLNPRHRRLLQRLARALTLRQSPAHLPEEMRTRLLALLEELERLAARIEKLLVAIATRTPPEG